MNHGITREDYEKWFKAVDDGPFHSLCCGERVHGPAMDMRILLASAASATRRIEICPTLYVLPMHNATRVAKEIATLDVLAGAGRMPYVAIGYGGREQDYQAVGASFQGRYSRMDAQVKELRRVWRGEEMVPGAGSIGPTCTTPCGPKLLSGATGPKGIARSAKWADGLYAWSFNGELAELQHSLDLADTAWAEAERTTRPYRLGGCWYTLADNGQQKLHDYLYNYMLLAGAEAASALAAKVNRSSQDRVHAALDNAEAASCDAFFLVPATAELAEVDRLADILAVRQ